MFTPTDHPESSHDLGRIRIAWVVTVGAVLTAVAVIAAVYGTHAFTILGRLGLSIT